MEFVALLRSLGLIFCVSTVCLHGACGDPVLTIVVVNGTNVGPGVVEAEAGETVTLRCEVRGFGTGDTVAWMRNGIEEVTTAGRVVVKQGPLDGRGDASTDEALTMTIFNVSTQDSERYDCAVKLQGAEIYNPWQKVTLTVFSFPGYGNPACTPSGPLTVDIGDSTALICVSRRGNPSVNMSIVAPGPAPPVTWNDTEIGNMIVMWTDLVINASHDGFSFICSITSSRYPGVRGNCTMGPIHIRQVLPTTSPQQTFSQTPTAPATPELTPSTSVSPELTRSTTVTPEIPSPTPVTPELPSPTAVTPELPLSTTMTPELPRSTTVTPELRSPTTVTPPTSHTPPLTTLDNTKYKPSTGDPWLTTIWMIAFIVASALLVFAIIIIVWMGLKIRHMRTYHWTLGTDALLTRRQHARQRDQMKNGVTNGGFFDIPLHGIERGSQPH